MLVKSADVGSIGAGYLDTGQQLMRLKRLAPPQTAAVTVAAAASLGNGSFENWGESAMADNSQQTDTSTDIDTDERNQVLKLGRKKKKTYFRV